MKKKRTVIRLENVWKVYQMGDSKVNALSGLNLEIREGEFVTIMGPSGSGKCIPGHVKIMLANSKIVPIEELYSSSQGSKSKKDNIIILSLDKPVNICALDKFKKVKKFAIREIYKRKTDQIISIETRSGNKIDTTSEHPFFTLDQNGFTEVRAADLKQGDFVAVCKQIPYNGKSQRLNCLELLSENKNIIIAYSPKSIKKIFTELNISRKKICTLLGLRSITYDSWLYQNNIPLHKFKRIVETKNKTLSDFENYITHIKWKKGNSKGIITIPKKTFPELLEFYGYLVGDGWLDRYSVRICNFDEEIKRRFTFLSNYIFGMVPQSYKKGRLDLASTVLVAFFKLVFNFPTIQKSKNIKLPGFIFGCSNTEISSFIRALFDCDAHLAKNKNEIVITLASKYLIEDLKTLLLRFSIHSRSKETYKRATNSNMKRQKYFSLSISGINNLNLYAKNIGFIHGPKMKRLKEKLSLKIRGNTNVDVVPVGQMLKQIRKESGITLPRKEHKILWPCEKGIYNPSREKLKQIITIFKRYDLKTEMVSELENLCKADIFWDKVKDIKIIKKEIDVYDLNVPKAHNFIANSFIIHNSTCVNMVGCLDLPTRGKVILDGQDISKLEESELAQIRGRKIGFIFQSFNLINTLNAVENVALPMIFQHIPESERLKRAKYLLKLVELEHRLDHKPNEMSGGELQRVAIARSLANNPEVILADEPTGNLDSKTGKIVLKFLQTLHKKENKTIIMVTHDLSMAKYAQRVVHLRDGQILEKKRR